jgi:azurin
VGEEFKFAITTLTSKTGTDVLVRYKNNSKAVEHNWVLVKAGTEGDVANKGTTAAATGWIPQGHPGIVANTKLLKAGETGDARFTAPAVGKYKFICTFPGHFEGGMVGEFEVTP